MQEKAQYKQARETVAVEDNAAITVTHRKPMTLTTKYVPWTPRCQRGATTENTAGYIMTADTRHWTTLTVTHPYMKDTPDCPV